jgi:quinol monooxygenase YgiN
MFCVIYEFTVSPEHEAEFNDLWHKITQQIRENSNGLGSRLHKEVNKPNLYLAYAQWPNKQTWEEFAPLNVEHHAEQTKRMREICDNIAIAYQLEITDDLLS